MREQKWFFPVVDVVAALTDSPNPRDYWYRIKQRERISGTELSTICRQFKLAAPDGKLRLTDCSHAEGLLRIIQSIPSPKAVVWSLGNPAILEISLLGLFCSKKCLELLLRGKQPVVVCPARSIDEMRLPASWKTPLSEGRLLVLSPFEGRQQRRVTAELAQQRNRFVACLAQTLLVPHAAPGSSTEQICQEALAQGKTVHSHFLQTLPSL